MMRRNLSPEELALLTPIFGYDVSGGSGDSAPAPSRMANPLQYIQNLGNNMGALYSPSGDWQGDDALNTQSPTNLLMKGILASLAMYGGANALSGMGGAAGGGADAVAGLAGGGAGPATGLESLGLDFGNYVGATTAASPFEFSLPSVGIGNVGGPLASSFSSGGASSPSLPSIPGGGLLTNAVGAALGAASAKDQQQTQTREPWGPAQDWIKQNIARGQQLQKQYTDQPFSETQQTAYNNLGGLLNTINQGAGGLMAGPSAMASGANNYDRSNPRRQLIGSQFDLGKFMPGLLSMFGGK